MAPEIASYKGHSFESDWFNLGTLIFEMLGGEPPHYHHDKYIMMQNRINNEAVLKKFFSAEAKSLLKGLL